MFAVSTVDDYSRLPTASETASLIHLLIDHTADNDLPHLVEVTQWDGETAYPVLTIGRAGDRAVAWFDRTHRAVADGNAEAPATFIGTDGRLVWQHEADLTLTPDELADLVNAFLADPTNSKAPDIVEWEEHQLHVTRRPPSWLPARGVPDTDAFALRLLAGRAKGIAKPLADMGGPVADDTAPRLTRLAGFLEKRAAELDRRSRWTNIRAIAAIVLLPPAAILGFFMARGWLPWLPGALATLAILGIIGGLCTALAMPVTVPVLTPCPPSPWSEALIPQIRDNANTRAEDLAHLLADLAELRAQHSPADGDDGFAIWLDGHIQALSPIPVRLATWAALL